MQHLLYDNRIYLGVNIDHVATLRQARKVNYPDPIHAALIAEQAGADLITLHPREDGRHIQKQDVIELKSRLQTRMNLEIAVTEEMLILAEQVKPEQCCLVPEKRTEITTEGGLDVVNNKNKIRDAIVRLQSFGTRVSLFIDDNFEQVTAAKEVGADDIEIHTGCYANARLHSKQQLQYLDNIRSAVNLGLELGLRVNAGHGLHYYNIEPIAGIIGISELNIGHAIIARAVLTGLDEAVRTMKSLMITSRKNCKN